MRRHDVGHLRGDDRLDHELLAVEAPQLRPARQLIGHDERQGLVAVQQDVFSLGIAQRDADTIRIGIGGQHQIGAQPRTQLDGLGHRLALFGIGGFDGGEVAVDDRLLLDQRDVREAPLAQRRRHEPHAGAVQRRIGDLHVVELADAFGRERQRMHLI